MNDNIVAHEATAPPYVERYDVLYYNHPNISQRVKSSKMFYLVEQFKTLIAAETPGYTKKEVKMSRDLLHTANVLQKLFVSQDTPLRLDNNTPYINTIATNLYKRFKPMTENELYHKHRSNYRKVMKELESVSRFRDSELKNYFQFEKFLMRLEYANNLGLTCVMGVSPLVEDLLDGLSNVNRKLAEKYAEMINNKGETYKVSYMMDTVPHLIDVHKRMFGEKHNQRNGDYEKVFNEFKCRRYNVDLCNVNVEKLKN